MIKVIGKRGSGKTTKLLELAHENGYILVEPTYQMAKYAGQKAKEMNLSNVQVISAHDLIDRYFRRPSSEYRNCHYLIDELEIFLLEIARIEGYSYTVGDRAPRPKKDIVDYAWYNVDHDPFVGDGW